MMDCQFPEGRSPSHFILCPIQNVGILISSFLSLTCGSHLSQHMNLHKSLLPGKERLHPILHQASCISPFVATVPKIEVYIYHIHSYLPYYPPTLCKLTFCPPSPPHPPTETSFDCFPTLISFCQIQKDTWAFSS